MRVVSAFHGVSLEIVRYELITRIYRVVKGISLLDEGIYQFLPRSSSSSRGSEGMVLQKSFRIRYLRLAKIDFLPSKVQQNVMNFHYLLLGINEIFSWEGLKFIR